MIKLSYIELIQGDEENIHIVFLNQKLFWCNDLYHEKINHKYEGVVEALTTLDIPFEEQHLEFHAADNCEIWQYKDYAPLDNEILDDYIVRARKLFGKKPKK